MSKATVIRRALFWVTTLIVTVESAVGAYWDIAQIDYVREVFGRLGYPMYFAVLMGAWKAGAVAALLVPRFPRLKEWAYAGLVFVYSGAAVSHFAAGDPAPQVVTPLLFTAFTLTSWLLRRPASRDARPLSDFARPLTGR
ncbi:DoxX family protein [Longispora albida]|uniref:DoxX family protein n=1 Tax=Longispora albida TaxID=203523 RepID=UPI0003763B99|nr:DoxX family protein [Longispora albida]